MKANILLRAGGLGASLLALSVSGMAQAPSIASFSPYQAPVGGSVSISGNNLLTTSAVYFNNVPSTSFTINSDWGLTAIVPVGASTGKLKIVNSFGTYTTSSDFIVNNGGNGGGGGGNPSGTLSVSTFSPWGGLPGDSVTIEGSGYGADAQVFFGSKLATSIQVVSGSKVTAIVPVGAVTAPIKIVSGGASYTTSSNFVIGGASGDGGSESTAFINPPNINIPAGVMSGHPRIFIRQSDVPTLRSWATASNPVWQSLLSLAGLAKQRMDTNTIPDDGSGGCITSPTESYAQLFAFMAVVHPVASEREDYANRAHTLLMKVINLALPGMDNTQPYRYKDFATYCRSSWYGEGFPLTVDWIYSKFSAEDKVKIRKVFMRWIQENLRASVTNQEHPKPEGLYDDGALIDTPQKVRWATNNFYSNHARHVGLLAMALDDVDDVPSAPDEPAAGTLRKFVGSAIQAWMYQIHAYETTDGKGGVSPEGVGYGELTVRANALLMLALRTVGADNPAIFGPLAANVNSSYWQDDVANAYLHMQSPSKVIQESWIGPSYLPYMFSDASNYMNTDYVRVFGPLALIARDAGDDVRYLKYRWMIDNLAPGGKTNLHQKIYGAFDGSAISLPIFYFLVSDPNVTSYTDPRPLLPTEHWAPGLGVLLARTDWTDTASWFVAKSSWNTIDHQFADANSFGLWRKGEWLTKAMAGYGAHVACSDYQNTLAIENPATTNVSFWQNNSERGSQYVYNGTQDPTAVMASWTSNYAYFQSDATATYNNPQISAGDVEHASRSTVWVKPDFIVTYDRAKTTTANRYKKWWINTPAAVTVSGRNAKLKTASGQQLFVSAVLPTTAVMQTSAKEALFGEPAYLEPMTHRLMVTDPANPNEIRYLNVLEGANAGAVKTQVASVRSTNGTVMEGVRFGTTAVMFKRNLYDTFTTTMFTLPDTVTTRIVTGLIPGGKYGVTYQVVGTSVKVKIVTGGAMTADSAGVLSF